MSRRVRTYGIGIGLFISLAMFLSYMAAGDPPDFGMMETVGYTSMVLALLMIVVGIRSRREEQGGVITFGEATKTGLAIAGVAALVVGLYTFAHIAWIDADYGTKYLAYEEERMTEAGMSQAEITEVMTEYEDNRELFDSPLLQGLILGGTIFVMGGVITLIAALFLRRDRKSVADAPELRTT